MFKSRRALCIYHQKGNLGTMATFSLDGSSFDTGTLEPGLYIVATPIGNLSDITLRALKTLAGADFIACEDTRTTGKLLKHFGIKSKMIAYHEHNAQKAGPNIVSALEEGKTVALVSDAGTPLISDPGYKLVGSARDAGIRVIPIPGASSPMAAIVASGLQTDSFLFAGFLPSKSAARCNRLQELADLPSTVIYFESPNRLVESLDDMISVLGRNREAAICRELTKLHEEISTGSLAQLAEIYSQRKIRGEIVIVIGTPNSQTAIDIETLLGELLQTMSVSRAAAEAASLTGKPKRDLYQRALKISEN